MIKFCPPLLVHLFILRHHTRTYNADIIDDYKTENNINTIKLSVNGNTIANTIALLLLIEKNNNKELLLFIPYKHTNLISFNSLLMPNKH